MQLDYKKISKQDLFKLATLLSEEFESEKLSKNYLDWLYFENPEGHVLGYNAWYNGKLVAHYALIPKRIGQKSFLLSVNTCTHKSYGGKGLFKTLASKSYVLAKKMGFRTVVGVANKNSIFAFTHRLGFSNPFAINVFISGRFCLSEALVNSTLRENLNWRLSNPMSRYFVVRYKGTYGLVFHKIRGFYVYLASFVWESDVLNLPDDINFLQSVPNLFVMPLGGIPAKSCALRIPNFILPSPWHVIRKHLVTDDKQDNIELCALDMDTF